MKNVVGAFTRFLAHITRNAFGMAGAVLTTVSAVLFLTLFALDLVGYHGGPYAGILAFLIIPGLFLLGLALIPLGLWRERVRHRRALAAGAAADDALPVWDLNVDRVRRNVLVFLLLSVVNVVILAMSTYKGVEVMDSTPFCGAACHCVMEPEYTTYQRSPHARVTCVECHIGAGASWFVKSKLSGSWQLVSVAFNLYPRPIPTPVHSLRPGARHLRAVPLAEQVRGRPPQGHHALLRGRGEHGDQDVLLVQRRRPPGGAQSRGIHWHVDPGHVVRYRADAKRQTIYEIEMTAKDGTVHHYIGGRPSRRRGGRGRVAHDGLRRLPQPPDARLPPARGRARRARSSTAASTPRCRSSAARG